MRLEALAGTLVRVGDDPFLAGRERRPATIPLAVEQAGHRVARHGPRQLRMTGPGQPRRRPVAVREAARGIVGRERLVGVVEQGRRLDQAAIDGDPALLDPGRQPAGHLAHGACVPHEPGWGIQGEQEGGGIHPPRDRHRLDGTRRSRHGRRWRGRRSGPAAAAAGSAGGAAAGTSPVTGIAHRNARAWRSWWPSRRRPPARPGRAARRRSSGRLRPGPSSRSRRTRRRPSRPGRSAGRGHPMPRADRGSPSPDGRTGFRRRPTRPRPWAASHRRTPASSPSGCRGGRP